jgi:hypothetical protein
MPHGIRQDKERAPQKSVIYSCIMSTKRPKSFSELVSNTHSAMGRLASEARQKIGLTDHIRAGLAPDLAQRMISCNLDPEGILTIRTAGPEWAARFRFESDRILTLCRQRHPEACSVRIGVAHPDP